MPSTMTGTHGMRKILKFDFILLLIALLLVLIIVIHEIGHTALARLLGDPDSVFYLVKVKGDFACCGFTDFDTTKLSWGDNLVVSLGGLLATQLVALVALFLLRFPQNNTLWRRALKAIALGFAFFDVPVQVIQASLYDLDHRVWPTNVDLMDVMLLLQTRIEASQIVLKAALFIIAAVYLVLIIWLYKRSSQPQTNEALLR